MRKDVKPSSSFKLRPPPEKAYRDTPFGSDPELEGKPAFSGFIYLAKRHYEEVRMHERSALQNARQCGRFLNEAKKAWKKRGTESRWLWKLKQVFPDIARRTAQLYTQISSEWNRIEPLLVEHPSLSIAAARRFLCHRSGCDASQGV